MAGRIIAPERRNVKSVTLDGPHRVIDLSGPTPIWHLVTAMLLLGLQKALKTWTLPGILFVGNRYRQISYVLESQFLFSKSSIPIRGWPGSEAES